MNDDLFGVLAWLAAVAVITFVIGIQVGVA